MKKIELKRRSSAEIRPVIYKKLEIPLHNHDKRFPISCLKRGTKKGMATKNQAEMLYPNRMGASP